MFAEIRRHTGAVWSAFHRYASDMYEFPTKTVRMAKNVPMLQAEVREDLLYGYTTGTLLTQEHSLLHTQYHPHVLRCIGVRKR